MVKYVLREVDTSYEGIDRFVHEESYCIACKNKENATMRCGRCHVVYYCSKACQKKHFPEHKATCKRIASLEKEVAKEAGHLYHSRDFGGLTQGGENLFETDTGHFWELLETRDYMVARLRLANEIFDNIANEYETMECWQVVVTHYQELLRLDVRDNLQLRYRFPFLLLYMNRDDDAFDFCCHWVNRTSADPDFSMGSKEGDWIYKKREGSRFLHFWEESEVEDDHDIDLPFLLAVATIKTKIVCAHKAKEEATHVFLETPAGRMLDPVKSTIAQYIVGSVAYQKGIADQAEFLGEILAVINNANPTMLRAILNPCPMLEQEEPKYIQKGHPSECYGPLTDSVHLWCRTPGALALPERYLGRWPDYNCDMDVCMCD